MAAEPDQIQRQVERVAGKIDRLEQRIESGNLGLQATVEALTQVLNERHKRLDVRFDVSEHQQEQARELLSGAHERRMSALEAMQKSTEQHLVALERRVEGIDIRLTGADRVHDSLAESISNLRENTTYWTRWAIGAFAAAVLSIGASLLIFYITK